MNGSTSAINVQNPKPNKELLEALEEGKTIFISLCRIVLLDIWI